MKVHQRDIVEVNFLFPDGKMKPHMAVVVSNDELNETESFFYLAMISSKNYNTQCTFVGCKRVIMCGNQQKFKMLKTSGLT